MLYTAAVLFSFLNSAFAECPNACSAHGKCGAYDMCSCYRNWMSNDCSERICQFGLAHVDIPKGDLDASSGALTMTDLSGSPVVSDVVVKSAMYPKGTSEQFPNMVDSAQNVLTNTGHDYAECSNKGICDRATGACQCFDGYGGSACQRATCPDTGAGVCSGHGTCENIKTLARWDFNNIYKLWDESASMGCKCDAGYAGADCSERQCKFGADPLYLDSFQTVRYSNWTYGIYVGAASGGTVHGNYSLVYTDPLGETWQTAPIDHAATCSTIISALEELPNDVIPAGTVECFKHATDNVPGTTLVYEPVDLHLFHDMRSKYTIAFPENPGRVSSLAINTKLDGKRDTLYSGTSNTLKTFVYNNGFYGENKDFVPDLCEGVLISFDYEGTRDSTTGLNTLVDFTDAAMLKKFKQCLGSADGNTANNVEVENWDHGTADYPHLIKVVDATQEELVAADPDPSHMNNPYKGSLTYICPEGATLNAQNLCVKADPPGFYVAIYYSNSKFQVLGRPAANFLPATQFHVYTTTGRLQVVSQAVPAFNTWQYGSGPTTDFTNILTNKLFTHGSFSRDGVDCETNSGAECLEKGDYAMVFANGNTFLQSATVPSAPAALSNTAYAANPIYPQIYQVMKVSNEPIPTSHFATSDEATYTYASTALTPTFIRNQIVFDKPVNARFHAAVSTATADSTARVYKFYPPTNAYEYAGQCSMRGICDKNTGTCACFGGYDGDNCKRIDALATR